MSEKKIIEVRMLVPEDVLESCSYGSESIEEIVSLFRVPDPTA